LARLGGWIDEADRGRIRGWARNPSFPDASVSLLVTADDRLLDRVIANFYRPDLERFGIGHGKFGFEVVFNPPLLSTRSWVIHVRSEFDGLDVPGSPIRIPASAEFDSTAQAAFAAIIGTAASDTELDQRIGFLAAQQERLLQMRADLRSNKAGRPRRKGTVKPARRALVLDEQVPEPDRDAGSSALMSHMRSLQRLGFDVTFAAPPMGQGEAAAALERTGISVCHGPWFGSVEDVLRREAERYDVVYLHRVSIASAYAALVRRYQPRTRLIYSVADLHHLRLARQAKYEDRPELLAEAGRVRAQELWAAHSADAVITHSSAEAGLLRQAIPAERVHVIAWSIPCRPRTATFKKRHGMAFIGHFGHAPNVAAARQLRDEILPMVHAIAPDIGCRLVGSDLPRSLQAPQPGLDIVGRVASLDEVFDAVRLTIAPLGFGAGLKGKVLESLAAGTPCVCSPIAAEGMDLPAGLRDLVVTDNDAAVRMILRLHEDEAYNAQMATLGVAFAGEKFSEEGLDRAMRRAVGDPETVDAPGASALAYTAAP
jgi:glycosyltransferase involved in cell wall biosynthesis